MALRLALALGVHDPDRLLQSMTPEQFREWVAFWRLERFGDHWQMAAEMTAMVCNTLRGIAAGLGGKELRAADIITPGQLLGKARPHDVEPPRDQWQAMSAMAGGVSIGESESNREPLGQHSGPDQTLSTADPEGSEGPEQNNRAL